MKRKNSTNLSGQSCPQSQQIRNLKRLLRRTPFKKPMGSIAMGLGIFALTGSAYGQAVSLGQAYDFAILSASELTNTGLTVVNGDVGLSPSIDNTGFTFSIPAGPGIVNGTVYYNDSTAQTVRANVQSAYDTLAGLAFDTNLTDVNLGGLTLEAGVYRFNSSAQLTGVLTLDTGSDPNAVFVFQIGSTLTTAPNASIVVIGAGAGTAPNIFWQVGSSATLDTGTIFTGNILANISISVLTSSQLTNSRLLALNGAVTLDSNNLAIPSQVLAAEGRFWNGRESNLWSEVNWSEMADGLDPDVILGNEVDVVFSIDEGATNQDTILDSNVTISSLTVRDGMAVTIGNDINDINGPYTLTISATGLVTGINIEEGAGLTTINSNLELGYLSQIIDVNNLDGLVINGIISGSNGLTKAGTGTLILTGTNVYTSATVVSGGILQLGDGETTGTSITTSNSVLITEEGVIAINLADGETFFNSVTNNGEIRWIADGTNTQDEASIFSGLGSMSITAAGSTVLLGANTFSGGTTVNTDGDVLVGNPSAFGTGTLTIVNGTIDTSDSLPLDIEVGGYVQSGGVISMHIGGTEPGEYTRYLVDGNTELSGGTVFLYNQIGNYVPQGGDQQIIINSTGELTGQFSSNFPQSQFYNSMLNQDFFYSQGNTLLYPEINYDLVNDNVNVLWVQDEFASLPDLTPNQNAVADALDENLPPEVVDYLNGQDLNDLPGMYDLIAPDELTAIFQMGFTAAEIQNTNIQRHLDKVRRGTSSTRSYTQNSTDSKGGMVQETVINQQSHLWSVFLEGTHGSTSVDSDGNGSGYDFDSISMTLGVDKRVSENLAYGVLGSYTQSDASLINGGSIDAESYKAAVYATVFDGDFYVDGLLGAGINEYDTRRSGLLGYAEADPNGWELNAMLNTGYNFRSGNWVFTPNASISYTRITLDGFSETGSLAPLSYPSQHQESLRSEIGAKIAYNAILNNGVVLTPQIRVAWQHEFMDSTQTMDSQFITGGSMFTVAGPHMDRDRALLSAGISAQLTPTICIYGYYDGQINSSEYTANQFTAGIKIDF